MLADQQDCAILVISSDRYSDLWDPFFHCFVKRWPKCPYKVYLGSNETKFENGNGVETILSGPDRDWSSSFLSILSQIPEKYLFIFLEDFFPISDVSSDVMLEHFEYMKRNGINHMHDLYDSIPCDGYIDKTYGVYEKGAPYRVNVYGFWNKECLSKLLIEGENPWNFEIMGSYRSSYFDNFYSMLQSPFKIMNMVEKGRYFKSAVDYAREQGIPLKLDKRVVIDSKSNLLSLSKMKFFILTNRISWRHRLKLMNTMRKILSCY